MNRQPWILDGATWDDHLSPYCVRMVRPLRRWLRRRRLRLPEIAVHGVKKVEPLLREGSAILITPNHPGDADAFVMCDVADRLGRCFHFMAANHMFVKRRPVVRWLLQLHGCFSVDREGSDLRAFRRAVKILQDSPYPLVIFPEGEIYHLNDRVTPFRDGPAVIALSAARRAKRPVYCVPCAIKYHYIQDPTPALEALMTELEMRVNWRPRSAVSLAQRILKYAEGQMALKEVEYLGSPQKGTLPERLTHLREYILSGLESQYALKGEGQTVPERVKALRRACLARLSEEELS
ncbi:1-acyl-sn-glycerol-3-phosphate acyltransferase, partial [Acidobacteria bacterium AH-259-O06]|nr:1-acyl-sn-glycerol-3-phosphate acyltransferase [Acidobacteria bacterium AH-259-O06]